MNIAAIALTAAALAAAGTSVAASRATDLDYLKASRCKGLAETLGQADTAGLDAFLKAEGRSRSPYVIQRAEAEEKRAQREARTQERHERLSEELAGACVAYMGPAKDVAAR